MNKHTLALATSLLLNGVLLVVLFIVFSSPTGIPPQSDAPADLPVQEEPAISSFEDCVASGRYPILESDPRQCGGFTEIHPDTTFIRLINPQLEMPIASPVTIEGEAIGTWFFEGSFPVLLTNWDGVIIAEGIATAQGEWMTEDFVPFTATLTFETPAYGDNGTLILKKDNPSGLPEHDDAVELPVIFAQ